MRRVVKGLIGVISAIVISFSLISCLDMFTRVDNNSNVSKTEGVEMNFNINVTNSLDIVPDGVAVLDVIRPTVVEVYSLLQSGRSSGSGVLLSKNTSTKCAQICIFQRRRLGVFRIFFLKPSVAMRLYQIS